MSVIQTPIYTPNGLYLLREFSEASDEVTVVDIAYRQMALERPFYAFNPQDCDHSARQFLARAVDLQEAVPRTSYKLAVASVVEPNTMVGYVAIDSIGTPWSGQGKITEDHCDIGYFSDTGHKGVASEAAFAILRAFYAAFPGEKHNYVTATVHPDNKASIRILDKTGFQPIGETEKIVQGKHEPRLTLAVDRASFNRSLETYRAAPAVA